ncbi:MAG: ATP synthase F1 subunit delta [Balneolaceae bacterium]
MIGKAARRYARAFLKVSLDEGKLEVIHTDLQTVQNVLVNSRDLAASLKSPVIRLDVKREVVQQVFSDSVDPLTRRFLDFVIEKRRANLLSDIVDGFLEAYKAHIGIQDVLVASAVELEDETHNRLSTILEQQLKGTVAIESRTDSSLLGGMSVQIGDTIIDGTVRHKLNRLATSFKEAAINQ